MKVWVVGGDGTLGTCTSRLLRHHAIAHVCTDLAEVDITDAGAVDRFAATADCSHIVNCAAYTAVDAAEENRDAAAAVNDQAVGHLAAAAVRCKASLVHVSTDYVFDGTATEPYGETAPTAPSGAYGATKLAGEERIAEVVGGFTAAVIPTFIIRTSWLFGPRGRDFVGTMSRLVREREEVRVVADQRGRPTYAPDLAATLLRLSGIHGGAAAPSGIYHFANAGETTWFDFTVAIAGELDADCRVVPITTAEFPTAATRPAYSVLSTRKLTEATGIEPRPWTEALADCVNGQKERS